MRLAALAILLAGCGSSLPGAQAIGDCAGCHAEQAQEFATSRHHSASTSPTFMALRTQAGRNAAFCDSCHQPDGSSPGLTCLTCHTAIGNQAQQNGQLLFDASGPVEVGDAEGLSAPHAMRATGFLRSSALCATCHDVNGAGAFHEQPFESWSRSPAAQQGQQCQACHLSPTPGLAVPWPLAPAALGAPTLRPHASHRFIGLGADAGDAAALLATGLALSLSAIDGGFDLGVTNVGQGHRALSGAAFVRGLSAEIEALAADGGAAPLASMPLEVELSRDGAPESNPLLATAWLDQGLDPGESRHLAVAVPEGARSLQACLNFADVRTELTTLLGVAAAEPLQAGCIIVELDQP
jgi:hypothetical protein